MASDPPTASSAIDSPLAQEAVAVPPSTALAESSDVAQPTGDAVLNVNHDQVEKLVVTGAAGDSQDQAADAEAWPAGPFAREIGSASPSPPSSSAVPPSSDPTESAQPPIKLKRRRPPPPKKGILKPPSSANSSGSRFSFRRDILQPLQYSRLAGGVVPVGSGVPVQVMGEAMGNAAATAGGWMGSAFKKLSMAAGVGGEGVHPTGQGGAAGPGAGSRAPGPANGQLPSHAASTSPAISALSELASSPSRTSTSSENHHPSLHPPTRQPPAAQQPLSISSLKLVRFRMASLAVIYPINGASLPSPNPSSVPSSSPPDLRTGFAPGPPLAPAEEAATKKRVNQEWRSRMKLRGKGGGGEKEKGKAKENESAGSSVKAKKAGEPDEGKAGTGWTGLELGQLYRECCRTREEPGIERVKRTLRDNPAIPPKTLDLSHELLSHGAVEALADLLSVDWGLKKLVLDSCGLDDESLKPLLHALLVSGSVPTISFANNKRIRSKGWKLIAVFIRKAKFLRYLDLSENNLDRKAADWIVQALTPAQVTPQGPTSDQEPANEVEMIDNGGTENEAEEEDPAELEPLFEVAPLLKEDSSGSGGSVLSLRLENCGLRGQGLDTLAQGVRVSALKHISLRRNRINPTSAVSLAVMIRDFPLSADSPASPPLPSSSSVHSSASSSPFSSMYPSHHTSVDPVAPSAFSFEAGNSVTARQGFQSRPLPPPEDDDAASSVEGHVDKPSNPAAQAERDAWRGDEMRMRLKRRIDDLPRVGALLTLDVKGNDIRNGVVYIAQALKRNRTLKVLNLSENKIDVQGLVAIADALRYNTTLETLDVSVNPCCGPGVEGILALRSAMMVTPSLKRVFLNNTDLSSEGAIALAEFLPETRSLLHLDLSQNAMDISGVLALAVSVKLNSTIRCLDLNIPPNDPDFSRLSQDILETCVRNTELAQAEADGKGKRVVIARPIQKSALAVNLEARQLAEERQERRREERSRTQKDILAAAAEARDVVSELLSVDQAAVARGVIVAPSEVVRDALVQLQLAEAQLAEAFTATRTPDQRECAELLLTELSSLLDLAKALYDRPPPPFSPAPPSPVPNGHPAAPHLQIPNAPLSPHVDEPSSPSFSLVDSDEEDDEPEPAPPASSAASATASSAATLPPAVPDLEIPIESSSPPSSPSSARSPIESESRAMVLEEGEVLRKGLALGAAEVSDEDGDDEESPLKGLGLGLGAGLSEVSGEDLKKEILEAKVQRSPRSSFSSSDATTTSPIEPDLATPAEDDDDDHDHDHDHDHDEA
ncbi:hypothetical protein JCM1841_003610 [Sporobolomyces salmonicolor]